MNCPVCQKLIVSSLSKHLVASVRVEKAAGKTLHAPFYESYFTAERAIQIRKAKEKRYRAEHPEIFRAHDRKRYPKRQQERRMKVYGGRRCEGCGILLISQYGGHGTKVNCDTCKNLASVKKIQRMEYMRKWRAARKAGKKMKKKPLIVPEIPKPYFVEIKARTERVKEEVEENWG